MKVRTVSIAVVALGLMAVVAILLVRALSPPATIIVHNASAAELRNVVVSGRGFRVSCPTLPAGQSVTLSAQLTADTGIAVAFDAGDRHVSTPEQDYAGGGGFRINVEVSPELVVSVRSVPVA